MALIGIEMYLEEIDVFGCMRANAGILAEHESWNHHDKDARASTRYADYFTDLTSPFGLVQINLDAHCYFTLYRHPCTSARANSAFQELNSL